MAVTIGETVQQLQDSLRDYIEATYHVSDPTLVVQRQQILQTPGVIHQQPYLESTPRYKSGSLFRDLGLDSATLEVFSAVSKSQGDLDQLIYDPPYQHQAASTRLSLVEDRSLVVMTGTGSGKTECFLLPILGKLASEAEKKSEGCSEKPPPFARWFYIPMNALGERPTREAPIAFRRPSDYRKVYAMVRAARTVRAIYQPDFVSWCSKPEKRPGQAVANQRLLREESGNGPGS